MKKGANFHCPQWSHNLPGRHTAKEWILVLENMLTLMDVSNRFGGLMGNIKTPSVTEREQLQQYLSQHALKPIKQKPQGVFCK